MVALVVKAREDVFYGVCLAMMQIGGGAPDFSQSWDVKATLMVTHDVRADVACFHRCQVVTTVTLGAARLLKNTLAAKR